MSTRSCTPSFSLFAASVFAGICFFTSPSVAADNKNILPQDVSYYKSAANVWDIMQDSRKVRSLKTADENIRKAFDETLRKDYADIQKQVLDHLKKDPRYKDANLAFHEFRTPGAEPGSINADMDGRVLIEKSPGGEWIEIDRRAWQDVMNKAIAKKTGYSGKTDPKSLQDHAATYRQLATDQYHVEASRDYADQTKALKQVQQKDGTLRWTIEQASTVRQMRDAQTGELKFEKDGTPMFESESHLVKVKNAPDNSNLKLKDSEGLALMYYEKGNEQFRQFKEARALGNNDKAAMHLSESAVQMGKQAKTLKSMRDSYQRRGFDVGALPDNMQKAMDEIVKFRGDLESNPLALNKKMQDLGYRDLDDFNRKMGGQLESLKLATPKKIVTPSPDLIDFRAHIETTRGAGSSGARLVESASIGNNIFSKVKDALDFYESAEQIRKQAKSGEHTFLNIDQDDSALMENIKVYGMAALEISGVPQAMDAGFEADIRAKERIEQAIREGRAVDPVRETALVFAEVGAGAVRTVLLSPVESGIEKTKNIYAAAEGVYNEYKAASLLGETELIHQAVREKAVERELAFGTLSSIAKRIGSLDGDLIVAPVTVREPLYFSVMREASWTNAYTAEWEISGAGIAPLRKFKDLGNEGSNYIVHQITDAPSGRYTVKLQIRENASGKIAKNVSTTYEIGGVEDKYAGIGTLSGYLEVGSVWQPVSNGGTYKAGQRIKLTAKPQGYWDDTVTAEWSVDGNTLSETKADQDKARQIFWTLDDKPHVSLSLRLMKDKKIIAYEDFKLSLAADPDKDIKDKKDNKKAENKKTTPSSKTMKSTVAQESKSDNERNYCIGPKCYTKAEILEELGEDGLAIFGLSEADDATSRRTYTVEDTIRNLEEALAKINANRARAQAEYDAKMEEITKMTQIQGTVSPYASTVDDQIRGLAKVHAECLAQQAKAHMDQAKYHEKQMGGDGDKSDSLQKEINQLSRGKGRVTNKDRIEALKKEKERIDVRVVPLRQYAAEEKNKAWAYSMPRINLVDAIKKDDIDKIVEYGSSVTCLGKGGDQFTKLAAQRMETFQGAPQEKENTEGAGEFKKFGPHVRPLPCALTLVLVKIEGGKVIDDRGYHMYAETQNGCRAARGSFSLKEFARHAGNVCGVPVLHLTSKNDKRGWRSTIETAQERGFYPNAYKVVNGDPNTTNRPLPENLGVCPW